MFYYMYYYHDRFSINSSEIFVSHPRLQLFKKYTLWTNFAVFPLDEKTSPSPPRGVCEFFISSIYYLNI